MNYKTLIIISAFHLDARLLNLVEYLVKTDQKNIIIMYDSNRVNYNSQFAKAKELVEPDGSVISLSESKGKGFVLKVAFSYVVKNMPTLTGVVTVDWNGQYTAESILNVEKKFLENSDALVLGVRNFDDEGIPWKLRVGNKLTRKILRYVSGLSVKDALTGLRAIPVSFLPECLSIKENGVEYEMEMLLRTSGKIGIVEVPVDTGGESKIRRSMDFNPVFDSIKVYKVLCRRFFIFIFSSFSSSIIDLTLFTLFCFLLKQRFPETYILTSTVFARIISACYNYAMNYKKVFHSKAKVATSGSKYALLAILQMSCSALMVNCGKMLLPFMQETVIKIFVDIFLFFISYKIQQKFVYRQRSQKSDLTK